MSTRRFRKFSLRLALFVVVPLSALGFFVSSRVTSARKNVAVYQSLYAAGVISEDTRVDTEGLLLSDDDVWWDTFWGGNPLSKITVISIAGTDEEVDAIAALPNLQWLDLNRPVVDVTAGRISRLAKQHPSLKKVSVGSGNLTAETWRAISQLPALESFKAHSCNLADDDVHDFENTALRELQLSSCSKLTGACCGSISRMRGLVRLLLHSTPITDGDISQFDQLTRLETFSLHRTQVTGSGLAVVQQMPTLTALSVTACSLDDVGFDHIQSLRRLTQLSLDATPLDDVRLANLSHMTELHFLSLGHTNISDEGVFHLLSFPELRHLDITFTNVTDSGIRRLSGLKRLQELHCAGTYTSPGALNQMGDEITAEDRAQPLSIYWLGAACIETNTMKIVGYLPVLPEHASKTLGVVGTNRTYAGAKIFPLNQPAPYLTIAGQHRTAMLSADGDRLASLADDKLSVYELPTGRLLSSIVVGFANLVAVSTDVVITDTTATLQAWDINKGTLIWSKAIRLKPTGSDAPLGPSRIWLKNRFGLTLVDTDSGEAMFVEELKGESLLNEHGEVVDLYGIDGSRPIIAQRIDEERIEVYDLDASRTIATIAAIGEQAVMSANARFIAVYNREDRVLTVFETLSGREVGSLPVSLHNYVDDLMKFTPDGKYLIVELDPDLIDERYSTGWTHW